MRQKQQWEIKEEELLSKEYAYLQRYNLFEQIIDDHLYFCLFLAIVFLAGFMIGFLIGVMV